MCLPVDRIPRQVLQIEPFLQEIFVKRVAKRTNRDEFLAPLLGAWMNVDRVKFVVISRRVLENVAHGRHFLQVRRIAKVLSELREF